MVGLRSYCKGLVVNEELVQEAYRRWLRAAAGRKNAHRVEEEHGSAAALIREITTEIQGRRLVLRPIRRYRHREPTNGKVRVIGVQSVKQQVCDYVAVTALEPLLAARIGFYQVASVKGKGQLFAARTLRKWVREGGYWVHADVRQCYPSIRHEIVMGMLRRQVRSADVLYVAEQLLGTYGAGLDIGSYFSLRMAQLVLSSGYHHVEDLAKTRRGKRKRLVTYQIWYADDIVLLGTDKRDLRMAIRSLERHLAGMGLALKPWKICRVGDDEPIDLAGYVTRPGRTTIRASIFLRARRAYRQLDRRPNLARARRVCAYWGWLKHSRTYSFRVRNHIDIIQQRARILISAAAKEAA